MTDMDIQDFVTRFAAAWAARDGQAFLALWHPDGVLHSPRQQVQGSAEEAKHTLSQERRRKPLGGRRCCGLS